MIYCHLRQALFARTGHITVAAVLQRHGEASNAAVADPRHVIERILALKLKTVSVRNGGHGAMRKHWIVRADGPNDLVFSPDSVTKTLQLLTAPPPASEATDLRGPRRARPTSARTPPKTKDQTRRKI
jgi:hypothetical protein